MPIDLQPIAPAIALLGTLSVAVLGFYQWKRQHSRSNRSSVAESRKKAAEALWAKVEEINLSLRSFGADTRTIDMSEDLRSLNELFLKNSLYLEDSLQSLMNAYVQQLYEVAGSIEKYQELQVEWERTLASPTEPSRKSKGRGESRRDRYRLANAELEKMEALRAQVKSALLAAIDG